MLSGNSPHRGKLDKRIGRIEMVNPIERIQEFFKNVTYTVNGWRFDDLKQFVLSLHAGGKVAPTTNSITFSSSLERITANSPSVSPRIAFVSCMPAQDTGIATCSFYSWRGSEIEVDIFCPVSDPDYFFALQSLVDSNLVRILDVDSLLTIASIVRYEWIVFAVGNSNHHLYVLDCIKKLNFAGLTNRIVFYVHDPCLLNLIQSGNQLTSSELLELIKQIYPDGFLSSFVSEQGWRLHAWLTEKNVFGPRYFRSVGISKFLVNSSAAKALLQRDLIGTGSYIAELFHPVFLPLGVSRRLESRLREPRTELVIGTFGIPGAAKLTHLILEAANVLQARGTTVKLVIAGFHAKNYAKNEWNKLKTLPHLIFDGPTDVQLAEAMMSVDIAIQLRDRNLGESSGVVPQLIALRRPTIVSAIGTFLEYGNSVFKAKPGISGEELADLIENCISAPDRNLEMARYEVEKSPRNFRAALRNALIESSQPTAGEQMLWKDETHAS